MKIHDSRPLWLPCHPHTRRAAFGLAGLSLAALAWLQTPPAYADDALDAARKRYDVGQEHYVARRYWQAAKAFEEAYNLSKRGDLLFNAARAYAEGEFWVRALETYQSYLTAMPSAPDRTEVEERMAVLRAKTAKLMLVTKEQAFVYIDGHEYGKTPMDQPIDVDSGKREILVRQGNLTWSTEARLLAGQTQRFEVQLSQGMADTSALISDAMSEDDLLRTRTRRLALLASVGAALDVAGNAFPPHQAAIALGADYRGIEGRSYALDVALRIPFEVGQSWRNSGFLLGVRGVFKPTPRRPLELFFELSAGLGVLEYTASATLATKTACTRPQALSTCSVYGVRVHPVLGIAYRLAPAFELRGELIGLDLNLGTPIADPRLTIAVAAAYRAF